MKARYYDSEVGRFISEDPLGFEGGSLNLYVYAANNPIMFMDPSRLCVSKVKNFFGEVFTAPTSEGIRATLMEDNGVRGLFHLKEDLQSVPVNIAIGAAGWAAWEYYVPAMVAAGTPLGQKALQFTVDAVNSYLPGTPTSNIAGIVGVTASKIYGPEEWVR